jgi:hypothetical protein
MKYVDRFLERYPLLYISLLLLAALIIPALLEAL